MSPKPVPPRGRSLFRQANMTKAARAAEAAGLEIGAIEVDPNGTIRVLTKDAAGLSGTAFDNWIAKHNAPQT